MGRWLMTLMLVMLSSLAAKAAEAYACYTSSNKTLTFYYDNQRSSRTGTTYDLNESSNNPGWYTDKTYNNVTKVVFNSSFANARPTSTYRWFSMMANLTSITGISNLNTEDVTNMSNMFFSCSGLTSLDMSHFNTANVTNMNSMFFSCRGLTSLDVSNFNTANVTAMYNMFNGCRGLTSLDVSNFNTSKVTDMRFMFNDCPNLKSLDVSNFNTANVTRMSNMFSGCTSFKSLDVSNFNTANVTSMYGMFNGCTDLTTIYAGSEWTTNAVTTSTDMFADCTNLVGGMGTTYDPNHIDGDYAHIDGGPSNPGYFTLKGPEAYACYTPSNTTLTFYCDDQRSSRTGTTYDLNTGSNDPDWYNLYDQSTYTLPTTRVVFDPSFANARPTSTYAWFNFMECLESIEGIEYLNTSEVTDMSYMFCDCPSLTSLDLSNFNTANVTSMTVMFYNCSRLTSLDLGNFNTSNVTDMEEMFSECISLTAIYAGSGWSTAAVTYSDYMFYHCFSLVGGKGTTFDENHMDAGYAHIDGGPSNPGYFTDANVPRAYACYTPGNTTLTFYYDKLRYTRTGKTYDLNTGNNLPGWFNDLLDMNTLSLPTTRVVFDPSFANARPTSTYAWFGYMKNVQSIEGIGYLNTSNVTNMSYMFSFCSGLTSLDLSSFNTANVTSMDDMFSFCSGLTSLDLSSFNTTNVTDMGAMFAYCRILTTIYAGSGWTTDAVTNSDEMFYECTSLVGGKGTAYDENHMDAGYAHIDGGPSNPGYFTAKVDYMRGDVNGDGQVKIGDVTALINYLLSSDASAINLQAADTNQDGQIKIADVTALINYLLSGAW